ncbi:MAG TPA: hypothetical protein PLQ35_14435 [bacterium]|nr:hypothetical protein [bacterium]
MNDYLHPNRIAAEYNATHINLKTMNPIIPMLSECLELLQGPRPARKPGDPDPKTLRRMSEISRTTTLRSQIEAERDPQKRYKLEMELFDLETGIGMNVKKPIPPTTDPLMSGTTVQVKTVDGRPVVEVCLMAEVSGKAQPARVLLDSRTIVELLKAGRQALRLHGEQTGDQECAKWL